MGNKLFGVKHLDSESTVVGDGDEILACDNIYE